jgi:hypothetical protein
LGADEADGVTAILLRTASRPVLAFHQMAGLRTLIRVRWSGRLLAVALAYLLAIEAVIASVGMGMSAVAAPGQPEFAICSSVADHGLAGPSDSGNRNRSGHQSHCPFCFLAVQSAVHLATVFDGFTSPAYAELRVTGPRYGNYDGRFPPHTFYRTTGDPRGPPDFSV